MSQLCSGAVCPLCGSTETKVLFTKAEIPYLLCRTCHFQFSTPPSNANFQPNLADYENAYIQYLGSDPADKRNFDDTLGWMQKRVQMQGAKLLDVGAGGGKWVRHLRSTGIDAIGIEPNTALYGHFLAQDPYFINATLDDPVLDEKGPFDVITIFDVLEHVEDPRAVLSRIAALLKNAGWLFLSLPDVGSPTARMMGKYWHHFNRYHLSFFNRSTLEATGRELGFEASGYCHRGRYRPMSYVVRYLFEFLLNRKPPQSLARFDNWYVPMNVYDTMYLAFQKTAPSTEPSESGVRRSASF